MKSKPLLLALVLVLALTACPDSSQHISPPPAAAPPGPVPKAELETQIAVEQQLRHQTEALLKQQESTTSHWQKLTLIAFSAASILLIIGTALGAKARHDAGTPQP